LANLLFLPNAYLVLASGIVALLVSYYAFRYTRLIESGVLKFISFGFMLLGIGLISQSSVLILTSFNVAGIVERQIIFFEATLFYLVLQTIAYFAIALGYGRGAYGRQFAKDLKGDKAVVSSLFLPILLFSPFEQLRPRFFLSNPVFLFHELVSIILLGFIAFQGALIYSSSKNRLSLTVLLGFVLILIAHIGQFASSLLVSQNIFLVGNVIQFIGFLVLLVFLVWSGRIGTAGKV
jgi:hypothetical protein